MLPSYQPVSPVTDATVQKLQQAVQRALRRITSCPLLDGLLVTQTFATEVTVFLPHKLGRAAQGYLVVGLSNPATIYRQTGTAAAEAQTILLRSSAATTAQLWVF